MVERIAELVREKKIEGVADLRDESDRDGMRVVVEMKRDASPDVVLNQLYRFTPLQTSFGVNMLALDRGRPRQMGLRDLITAFVDFREEVVVRRVKYELSKARDRGHVLVGLAIAVANIDEFIHIIRSSKDPTEARERLVAKPWPTGDMMPLVELIADPRTVVVEGDHIRLTEEQARAILAPRRDLRRGARAGRHHPWAPGDPVLARKRHGHRPPGAGGGARPVRRTAPDRDHRRRRRRRGRGPDRP
jgi:DNA gyrase subunit A